MSFDKKAMSSKPPRIHSAEAMLSVIREMGIVPFFSNPIIGYSIEEMTDPDNWFDTQENLTYTPWDWKIPCVQSGEIAYGKFLWGGKAAFATIPFYRELLNYRRSLPKYAPDASQKKILEYLEANGSIGIKEIRALLGIKKGQADTLVMRLMMQCRVVTGDIIRVYRGPDLTYNGWQHSSFCTPEALFADDAPFSGFAGFPFASESGLKTEHSPSESYALLKERIRSIAPDATDSQISKMLG